MSSGNDRLETTMVVFPAVCGGIFILLLMSFCKKCGFTDTYDINANKYFQSVLYVCIRFYVGRSKIYHFINLGQSMSNNKKLMRSDETHACQLILMVSIMPHD